MVINMYEKNMMCKHFKGKTLLEKNIYQIIDINILGKDLPPNIIYTGEDENYLNNKLIVYKEIFQNKIFAREEKDLKEILSKEKQQLSNQLYRVQPLNEEEIKIINNKEFKKDKLNIIISKNL